MSARAGLEAAGPICRESEGPVGIAGGAADPEGPHGVGPNAIIQMMAVMRERVGDALTDHVFVVAGLERYLTIPPERMVDEREVGRLHHAVQAELGEQAQAISHAAGLRTGDYLLAHRIPKPVQRLLCVLPGSLAARALLRAIARNAWTFCGSGELHIRAVFGKMTVLTIAGCPLCRELATPAPACGFYAATFERLFCELVSPRTSVREVACAAAGQSACAFEVRW